MTTRRTVKWAWAAAAAVLSSSALAEGLPNLPVDLAIQKSDDSPGQVTFRHSTHVDAAKPGCLACHPKAFGILGRSSEKKRAPITHAAMQKGEACGACHGKQAFGLDDCSSCHAQ